MVISLNKDVANCDFEKLLELTTHTLQNKSEKQENRYLELLGNKLENEVYEVMCTCAVGTAFDGTIDLVSGQKFPDIVANNYYGVEVKSTKQNHWKTTGNSILETTRVSEIERIYMLFGKMCNPISFKYKLYQDCLSDVIVTHSPRYAIDMNLPLGNTIFDKLGIEYDLIRKSSNPVKPFKEYYRNRLEEGQELWWLDKEEYNPESIIFKTWNSLPSDIKLNFKNRGYAYFPEILGARQTKFDRFTMWLSVNQRIICPNIRDIFTAGGRKTVSLQNVELQNVPKILSYFVNNIKDIAYELSIMEIEKINEIWRTDFSDLNQVKLKWINDIVDFSSQIYNFKTFDFRNWLTDEVKTTK